MPEVINPNSDRNFVNTVNITDVTKYPLFFDKIKFEKFNFMMNERSERKGGFINGRKKSS